MSIYISQKKKIPKGHQISTFKSEQIKKIPRIFSEKYDEETKTKFYKRVLVTINPGAGKKKALEIFKRAKDVLKANGILFSLFISKKRDDVKNHLSEMSLDKLQSLNGIFCFSGDSHIHEVLNGLMTRNDFNLNESDIAIAHFPCGSGCVLSEYITKITNSTNTIDSVLASVCRWRTTSIPLYEYQIESLDGSQSTIYSFLSLNIGFFADIDIESEFLRFMGHNRFNFYGLWRFLILKNYWLKIQWKQQNMDSTHGFGSFKDVIEPEMTVSSNEKSNKNFFFKKFKKIPLEIIPEQSSIYEDCPAEPLTELTSSYSGKLFSVLITTLPFLGKNYLCSPSLLHSLGNFNIQIAPTSMGRSAFYSYISKHENHYSPNHPLLIDEYSDEVSISLYDLEKYSVKKPHNIEMVIDGESYKFLNFKRIKCKKTETNFNLIL
jgi:diacylglycerol kinase family enzyme